MYAWQTRTLESTGKCRESFPSANIRRSLLASELAIDARGPQRASVDEARVALDEVRAGIQESTCVGIRRDAPNPDDARLRSQ